MARDLSIKGQIGNCNIGHYGQNRTSERNSFRMMHTSIVEISRDIKHLLQSPSPMSNVAQYLLHIMVTFGKTGEQFVLISKFGRNLNLTHRKVMIMGFREWVFGDITVRRASSEEDYQQVLDCRLRGYGKYYGFKKLQEIMDDPGVPISLSTMIAVRECEKLFD